MNKRNRLKIKSQDNTLTFIKSDSSIIITPTNKEKQTKTENIGDTTSRHTYLDEIHSCFDSLDFEPQMENVKPAYKKEENNDAIDFEPQSNNINNQNNWNLKHVISTWCIKPYWIYILFASVIIYLISRPSEYSYLLDEIEKLRKIKTEVSPSKLENIADLFMGTSISSHSALYKFGFFKQKSTDPNSVLESGNEFLCLKNENPQFFNIKFSKSYRIRKIAVYHPPNANPKSSMRRFKVKSSGDEVILEFSVGYQEYAVEMEGDSILFEILENNGECLYTSVYRVSVFV